jgi:large subunit ribosomal protein L10
MGKIGKVFRESLASSIKEGVKSNSSTFLLSYSAVSASQMDDLRKNLKRLGASVYVPKNRIAQIALQEADQKMLAEKVTGQTALIYSNSDASAISKALTKFTEKCQGLVIRGGLLDGVLLLESDVKRLADLPSREVLLSQLLQVIISPLTNLAGVLNGKTRELLSILKQLSEKKGGN